MADLLEIALAVVMIYGAYELGRKGTVFGYRVTSARKSGS